MQCSVLVASRVLMVLVSYGLALPEAFSSEAERDPELRVVLRCVTSEETRFRGCHPTRFELALPYPPAPESARIADWPATLEGRIVSQFVTPADACGRPRAEESRTEPVTVTVGAAYDVFSFRLPSLVDCVAARPKTFYVFDLEAGARSSGWFDIGLGRDPAGVRFDCTPAITLRR